MIMGTQLLLLLRGRRLKISLLILGAILLNGIVLGLVARAVYWRAAERRLQEAIAAIEKDDPVWRWENLMAQREKVPGDQNSAPHVLAAAGLLPKDWPQQPAVPRPAPREEPPHGREREKSLIERVDELEPCDRLDERLAQELSAELAAMAPALAKARPIINLPKGRHEVEWKEDYYSTQIGCFMETHRVAELFRLEAALKAHEGRWDEALAATQGALNTGRSIGDEPLLVTQLLRREEARRACQRRAPIPKGTGNETRAIGIPTFEDKVLQRAVVMVLETIYEQDFLDCSHGFRRGRSAHQALRVLWQQTMDLGGGWILETDIRKCFETLDHAHLRDLLKRRVRDGVLLRLIGKWLNAGVLDQGSLTFPEAGSPQGGVISPLLANVYLHYVLDVWFEEEVKPRLKGRAFLIRYADDFVMGFAYEEDARRVLDVLPNRFGKYGLQIHPGKTRLVPFQRPPSRPSRPGTPLVRAPGTFAFLGFRHYWSRSWKGTWVVKRQTAPDRFRRALRSITQWCRLHRHRPIAEQPQTLRQKIRGHFNYYGIVGNTQALQRLRYEVGRLWRTWLSRRHRRGQYPWSRFNRLLAHYPLPTVPVWVSPHAVKS
jgi:group II intron reverse transcriptase/maturase